MINQALQVFLKNHYLFSKLSAEQFQHVCEHALEVSLSKDEALFMQGDPVERFYVVIEGSIKLFRVSAEGQEKVVEICASGDAFAEALMFQDQAFFPVNALALGNSTLLSIDAGHFASMLHESVDTCFMLMREMSQRLHALLQEIDDISLQSGSSRLACYLLHHIKGDHKTVVLDIPKSVIASRLSIKPETLSRIMGQMKNQGVIDVSASRVEILDLKALAALSGERCSTL
ncbi:MAG: Crp/Fnr family transcriptional regulator [gamma proteobacterium symbiont of Bathyaustriella thionipta]|nr:Crp/Fnr family transcriptional regulator [gamma proteobacterium symbiont of Bathyaustriella thionipta]